MPWCFGQPHPFVHDEDIDVAGCWWPRFWMWHIIHCVKVGSQMHTSTLGAIQAPVVVRVSFVERPTINNDWFYLSDLEISIIIKVSAIC
jgi:hypothetical protein